MANFALVNNADHQDVRIITERAARYGDDLMQAPVFPFEFRSVQAFYPIMFQQDGSGGFQPVALFGFQDKENLFLGHNGWRATYIPAMVRRQPFLIGFKETAADGPERMLSLDMDHPRVLTEAGDGSNGEPLFQPLGGRTPFLENVANLLEAIYEGLEHSKAFVSTLQEHDLLETVTLEIALADGARNQLLGFHCLAEDKVQELTGAVLGEFNNKGFLMPIFMVLASMGNIQRLVEMKNKTLESGHELAV